MTRALLLLAALTITASPAFAIGELKKEWGYKYADKEKQPDYYLVARKAGCYVCHVKGVKDKKTEESRNEYGKAMSAFLKSKNVTIEALKEEYKSDDEAVKEGAVKKMLFMFEAVNQKKSSDGEAFGKKIAAGKLPATDAGLE